MTRLALVQEVVEVEAGQVVEGGAEGDKVADVGMAGGVLGKRVLDQTVTLIFGPGNL